MFVQQELEVHVIGKLVGLRCNRAKIGNQTLGIGFRVEQGSAETIVQGSMLFSRGMKPPVDLNDQLVDEFRQLLQRDAVHQLEVESGIVPQGGEFWGKPGRVIANGALNAEQTQASLIREPGCPARELGAGDPLSCLLQYGLGNAEDARQPVVRIVLAVAGGQDLARNGTRCRQDP